MQFGVVAMQRKVLASLFEIESLFLVFPAYFPIDFKTTKIRANLQKVDNFWGILRKSY